jgi:spore germination protein GerM
VSRAVRAGVLAACLAVGACGVPTGDAPTTIPASDVPYGLAEPNATTAPPEQATPMVDPSRLYLVAPDDSLVPRPREVTGGTLDARLEDLLADLAAGPTEEERKEQLSTALPPEVQLEVAGVEGGVATVDLTAEAEPPTGWASRRAVAQIVLTATSVPGVRAVLLTLAGEPVDVPLPSGELTADPVTAADYEELLHPPPPPSAVPAPTPAPAPSATPAPPS